MNDGPTGRPDAPAWRRALRRLEAGEESAAVAADLRAARSPAAVDRWVDALLLAELAPAAAGAPPPRPTGRRAEPSSDESAAAGSTLELLRLGNAALREGRVSDLLEHLRALEDVLPGRAWFRLRAASLYQAAFRFDGSPALRDRGVEHAARVADDLERPAMAVAARSILATIHLLEGRYATVLDRCDAAIELARASGQEGSRFTALAHQFRGYVLFEWNRLAEAETELERAWTLTGPEALGVRTGVARMLASLHCVRGQPDPARRWLEELESMMAEPITLRNREWLAAVRIRVGVHTDRDLRTVDRWRHGHGYDELDADDPSSLAARLHELESLLTVLEILRQWPQMPRVADLLLTGSRPARPWFAARALAGKAVALERLGRTTEAMESLDRALAYGETGGFVRCYIEGSPVRRTLLDSLGATGDGRALRVLRATGAPTAEAPLELTSRQRDVLELVADGLSNRAVADRLGVAETTVKTHLRDVYGRLDVSSRTAAVAAARRAGLLQD